MNSRRLPIVVSLALLGLLALPAFAAAADGEGLYGKTTDLAVTIFCFGVMIFFVAFVVGMSLLQGRLDSRKERAREEIERARPPQQ